MKKKLLSFCLFITLLFSMSAPAFAAAYSDLEGHWAKQYIEALVSKGYMSGYDDGTIRPEISITACETLALLSRFYQVTKLQNDLIQSDYMAFVKANVPSSLSWANDEIAICLAAEIITQDEIKSTDLTKPIEKEKLAAFLVRAMKMSEKAKSMTELNLTFADKDSISVNNKAYVALLVSLGIVGGDNNNNFGPRLNVTRAVAAKMVSLSLDYIQSKGISLTIDSYVGLARQEGIISSVSGSNIAFDDFTGISKIINIPAEASIKVNGSSAALSSAHVGCYVAVTTNKGKVAAAEVESDSSVKWVQGTLTGTYLAADANTLYLTDKSGAEAYYKVSSSADITEDGNTFSITSLTKGYFVTLKLENNVVTKIVSLPGATSITAAVTQLSFGSTVQLIITDANGAKYGFSFGISSIPPITRGSNTITIDRIQVNDQITLSLKNGTVTAISIADTGITVTGEISSITNTLLGTSWTIKKSDGTSETYLLDEKVNVFSGSTAIKISDIKVGDSVSVVVYGSTITEVKLQSSAVPAAVQVPGSVLLVSTENRTITLLTSAGKLIYINTSSLNWILYSSTGKLISLSSLPVNSQIVAYGAYSGSSSFAATVIVVLS